MTKRRRKPRLSTGQADAVRRLKELATAGSTPLVQIEVRGWEERDLVVALRLSTKDIEVAARGLPISPDHEDVVLAVPPLFPWVLPEVRVEHTRFVGKAHVLQGTRLCVYLDPSQEWHPSHGIEGFLNALWKWFVDAAAGRFDASRALFHPVGGVLHRTPGTPTIVVREPLGIEGSKLAVRWMRPRSNHRLDLVGSTGEGYFESLLVALPGPLAYGAGMTLGQLCQAITILGFPSVDDFLGALAIRAARNPPGTHLYFVLAVPSPQRRTPEDVHLLAGRLPPEVGDALRAAVRQAGPVSSISTADVPTEVNIEWCRVSEEREAVTTRRDVRRPVAALLGAEVALWGCGGLGSWIGEFLARAGVARVTVTDPGEVTGGLLVRQNFAELDIGTRKDEALAKRLRSLRHDLLVEVDRSGVASVLSAGRLPSCDLLIDATVSNSVGAAVAAVWETSASRPLVVTVATDRATSTLGYLSLTRAPDGPTPQDLDRRLGEIVLPDSRRELFHAFWETRGESEEVLPAPGCSVPTFHGSAADLAAVAASLVSLVGRHLESDVVGCHLLSLPYGDGTSEPHEWIGVA
jgi:hypothetical protein